MTLKPEDVHPEEPERVREILTWKDHGLGEHTVDVALVDGVPRTLNLRDALVHYLDHQREVIRRRTEFRLGRAQRRAHIVEGLVRALDLIDAIIAAIRASADRGAARAAELRVQLTAAGAGRARHQQVQQ